MKAITENRFIEFDLLVTFEMRRVKLSYTIEKTVDKLLESTEFSRNLVVSIIYF